MSHTDKTDPYEVKIADLQEVDPYGTRRESWVTWRPEFRCGRSCKRCWGWWAKADDRRRRQDGKRQARNWRAEYES